MTTALLTRPTMAKQGDNEPEIDDDTYVAYKAFVIVLRYVCQHKELTNSQVSNIAAKAHYAINSPNNMRDGKAVPRLAHDGVMPRYLVGVAGW